MIVLHCRKPRVLSLPVSPPIYRSKSAKHRAIFLLCFFPFLNADAEIMLNLLFNTLLTIIPHNTQKRRRRKERTTYGPLRRYSRWVTHPVRNPDRQGCLEYPSRRNDHNASDSNLLFLCLLLSALPSLC